MALSANMGSNLSTKFGNIQAYTAGGTIWRGSLVALNLTDGLAYAAEADADDSEKYLIIGWAMEAAVITGIIRVRTDGKLKCSWAGGDSGKLSGRLACVYDDETVQAAANGLIAVGRITDISSTSVYVDLEDRPVRLATGLYD